MIGLALGAMPCTQGLQLVWQEAIGSPNSGLLQPWRWPPKAARRQPQRWHAQGELKRLGSEGELELGGIGCVDVPWLQKKGLNLKR